MVAVLNIQKAPSQQRRSGRLVRASSEAAGENSGYRCIFSSTISSCATCSATWVVDGSVGGWDGQEGPQLLGALLPMLCNWPGTWVHHEQAPVARAEDPAARWNGPTSCTAAGSSSSEPQCASTMAMSLSMGGKRRLFTRCKKSLT